MKLKILKEVCGMRKQSLFAVMLATAMFFSCTSGGTGGYQVMAAELADSVEEQANVEQFDMPVVSIETDESAKITSNKEYVSASINVLNDDGEYDMSNRGVSIRLRGNSSLGVPKKSYKLKFEKKQNMLGIGDGKGKTWGLIANYYDQSLQRNMTMYKMGDVLDKMAYSPNCKSVEVYVNGEYQGVYLLTELANVNKNRVNVTEQPDLVEENGYMVEMSRYAEDNKFEADTETYEIKSDLSETESIKKEQIQYISEYIEKSVLSLKKGNQEEVAKYIDIDSLVDIYIANEVAKNVDTGWDSFYMFKDAGGKLGFGPIWDFDLALGNANCAKGFDNWKGFSAYTVLNVNANSNPWFCYALNCDWFRQLVVTRWNEVKEDLVKVADGIVTEAKANQASYLRNFDKWDLLGQQVYIEPAQISALNTYEEHYTYLSDWLHNRIDWLDAQYNGQDFANGILIDENGEVLSADANIIAISSIMAFGQLSYDMTDNAGMIIKIKDIEPTSWCGMALASGFMLEEGEEYTLSFDYSSTKDAITKVAVQENHDRYKKYLQEEINFTSELKHFEKTFTATANDTNAAFALDFDAAQFSGATVVLDNMSLVKKTKEESKGTASMEVTSQWNNGAVCNITVTNNSGKDFTEGWTLDFDLNREIKNIWCAELVSSKDGHYIIKNPSWKPVLTDGESYTFGVTVSAGDEVAMNNVVVK